MIWMEWEWELDVGNFEEVELVEIKGLDSEISDMIKREQKKWQKKMLRN